MSLDASFIFFGADHKPRVAASMPCKELADLRRALLAAEKILLRAVAALSPSKDNLSLAAIQH